MSESFLLVKDADLNENFSDLNFLLHGLLDSYQFYRKKNPYKGPKVDERLHWFKIVDPRYHSVFLWKSEDPFPWEFLSKLVPLPSTFFWKGNFSDEELEWAQKYLGTESSCKKFEMAT